MSTKYIVIFLWISHCKDYKNNSKIRKKKLLKKLLSFSELIDHSSSNKFNTNS